MAEKAEVAEQVREGLSFGSIRHRSRSTRWRTWPRSRLSTYTRAGGTDTIDALLDSSRQAELDEKAEMLGVAAQENTDALIRYSRLRLSRSSRTERSLQPIAAVSDRTAVLSRFRHKGRSPRELPREAAKAARDRRRGPGVKSGLRRREARGDVVEAQARNAVAALGTSWESAGFIWPPNGSVTSPHVSRWGRMHSGIDINGAPSGSRSSPPKRAR